MSSKSRLRPVLIEFGGDIIKADIVALETEAPVRVSMRVRDKGWCPYRVRFDETQSVWIVSSFDRLVGRSPAR
jgi:hypothetical protein